MSVKEMVLREAPSWSEEEAERALRAVHPKSESAKHGDTIDEWGNLSAMTRSSTGLMLKRLDDQEAAAGFSWDDHL
jgi:hypothetical protein